MKRYRSRVADAILKDKLEAKGAVVIEGPKWCGKTTTAMQVAKSVIRMDEPSKRDMNIQMADIAPERLLQGDKSQGPGSQDRYYQDASPVLYDDCGGCR